jgi:predicted transcriptional regulator
MRLDSDIMKKVKILAIEEGKKTNSLIEEALMDLLRKHDTGYQHDDKST